MATSDSPTKEEIYWGVCYRQALDALSYPQNPTVVEYVALAGLDATARRTADAALQLAKRIGYPEGF